jgi:ATP-dependent Lon protease
MVEGKAINVKVTELERVSVTRTKRGLGEVTLALCEPRPLQGSAEEQHQCALLRESLSERVAQELEQDPSIKLKPLMTLLRLPVEELPPEIWLHEVLSLLKPDYVTLTRCLLIDDMYALHEALADLVATHLLEQRALERIKSDMEARFSFERQRMGLRKRIKSLIDLERDLVRQHRHNTHRPQLQRLEGEELPARLRRRRQGTEESPQVEDDFDQPVEESEGALRDRLKALKMPEEVRLEVRRALQKFESGPPIGPEQHTLKSFLEVVAELPWERRSSDLNQTGNETQGKGEPQPSVVHNLEGVRVALDEAHEGLGEVKERVLEHLAVSQLTGEPQGSVLCLSGPPGVGKTSLVKQIAHALGRPFVRISLGGVEDQAAIRGHRRTYVGAMPGRICDALRQAKVKDPVILLDELDKLGESHRGSPQAALLEVLDPEQNSTFNDHYLELPLDLSEVMFVCTVNNPRALSGPLKDRLEMVELKGYTTHEKIKIAREHLLPRNLTSHGLTAEALTLSDDVLKAIIERYTKEAGVRQLERALSRLCRKLALTTVSTPVGELTPRWALTEDELSTHLGVAKYRPEGVRALSEPGLAHGLAWTAVGGAVLHIESAHYPGKGELKLTGQLGDVMRESAQTALTALRVRRGAELSTMSPPIDLSRTDLHVHLPEGATPKDGPSAGVTLYCALYSLLSGRPLRADVAMSGECTLQGRVLAVGGLQEKLLAAQREGMKRVILPKQTQEEVLSFEPEVRGALELVWVNTADEALEAALA